MSLTFNANHKYYFVFLKDPQDYDIKYHPTKTWTTSAGEVLPFPLRGQTKAILDKMFGVYSDVGKKLGGMKTALERLYEEEASEKAAHRKVCKLCRENYDSKCECPRYIICFKLNSSISLKKVCYLFQASVHAPSPGGAHSASLSHKKRWTNKGLASPTAIDRGQQPFAKLGVTKRAPNF